MSNLSHQLLSIEIIESHTDRTCRVSLSVIQGTTVVQAIKQAKCFPDFQDRLKAGMAVGIFSKKVTLDTPVSDGDRIEIYRPLLVTPKERRRNKALLASA